MRILHADESPTFRKVSNTHRRSSLNGATCNNRQTLMMAIRSATINEQISTCWVLTAGWLHAFSPDDTNQTFVTKNTHTHSRVYDRRHAIIIYIRYAEKRNENRDKKPISKYKMLCWSERASGVSRTLYGVDRKCIATKIREKTPKMDCLGARVRARGGIFTFLSIV